MSMREIKDSGIGLSSSESWQEGPTTSGFARQKDCLSLEAKASSYRTSESGGRRFLNRIAACSVLAIVVSLGMVLAPVTPAFSAPPASFAIGVAVSFGPPALPYYAQPFCPGPGYIWTPGYWAWDPTYGYYWVPGTWVFAPFAGALWTPGYWAWDDDGDAFFWHPGYWGPVVGFYGGIAYGYGYTGYGYEGGYWRGRNFYYNRTVNNINVTNITNVYNRTVVVNNVSTVSYNGGRGGIVARPTAEQMAAANGRRTGPVGEQLRQLRIARADPGERASVNRGRPAIAATPKAGLFRGQGVERASRAGATYREPPISRVNVQPGRAEHSNPSRPGWHAFGRGPGAEESPAPSQERGESASPARGRRFNASPEHVGPPAHGRQDQVRPPRVNEMRPPMGRQAAPDRRGKPPHPANKRGNEQRPDSHDQ